MEKAGKVSIYDLPTHLTPKIMKHTQACSTFSKLAPTSLETEVNKKGETLTERARNRMVRREVVDISSINFRTKAIKFSASIEDKRLTYLDRAKDYLKTAPADEILQLAEDFTSLKDQELLPNQFPPDKRPTLIEM